MLSKLLSPIDNILNTITMYRLVLYYLLFLWLVALVLSLFGFLPFTVFDFLISTATIFSASWAVNKICALVFNAITNLESVYISAAILTLILTPSLDFNSMIFIVVASIVTMSSKYILNLNKKHFFNPVAIGVLIPSIVTIGAASWWIGTKIMLLPVLLGGFLIIRKIQRFDLVLTFLSVATIEILFFSFLNGFNLVTTIWKTFLDTPILFFAIVMLTEPLTTPATRSLRMVYAAFVGLLFSPQIHVFSFYLTPESSLVIGNIFSFLVSPRKKLMLTLEKKIQLAPTVFDFVFKLDNTFSFTPGQYLEWTLNVKNPDSRGNRRYFTISSSPTERNLRIGVKTYPNPSSFKKRLMSLNVGDNVLAGDLSGDFTLPKDGKQKLVFMAGGIGITPFRSMIKYLLDKNINLPITIFYSNKNASDIVYKEVLDEAFEKQGIKTIYNLTDEENIPQNWIGYKGRINEEIIRNEVAEYRNAKFYLSGPHAMVVGFEDVLQKMGVRKANIKKDFFPGLV